MLIFLGYKKHCFLSQAGKATDCNSVISGSNPLGSSNIEKVPILSAFFNSQYLKNCINCIRIYYFLILTSLFFPKISSYWKHYVHLYKYKRTNYRRKFMKKNKKRINTAMLILKAIKLILEIINLIINIIK